MHATANRRAAAPWSGPLWTGLGLRVVAAVCGVGWFAPDDYTFVIAQSGAWLRDAQAPFACDYRSTLLPRIFWGSSWLGTQLGLRQPTAVLRFAFVALGIASVAAIPAVYKLTARHADALTARTAAWLMAIFFLLPRISTRPLLETAALVPLAWGALWLDRARDPTEPRWQAGLAAALCLGLACMLRFQVGVLVPAVLWLLGRSARPGQWRAWAGLATGALAIAVAQGALDRSAGQPPFGPPLAYLRYNMAQSQTFGVSPWYTYVGHFLSFTLPPVTLALALPLWRSVRRHGTAATLFVAFVLVHSLIGHKEDRFMFPILPLFFVLLGTALEEAARGGVWRVRAVRLFWAANALALVVATLSDAQQNLTRPLLHMARHHDNPTIATVGINLVPQYYLGGRGSVRTFDDVTALTSAVNNDGARFDYVLFRDPQDAAAAALQPLGCSTPQLFYGDWLDQLLVWVNRHNARRDATALLTCGETLAKAMR